MMAREATQATGWWGQKARWWVGSHRLPSRAQRRSIDVLLELCLDLDVIEFSESTMVGSQSAVRLRALDGNGTSIIADFWVGVDGELEMVGE